MNLLTRILSRQGEVARFSVSEWLAAWSRNSWNLNQPLYPSAITYSRGKPTERIENSFTGYTYGAYKSNPIIYGCMQRRSAVFSQARFMWRELNDGKPGDLFHDDGLALLERPWPNGSSGDLLKRMVQDVDLAGNAYIINDGDRLRRLRPDWVQIILSGNPLTDPDIDIVGYVYTPGGPDKGDGVAYTPADMCHWAPDPDPIAFYRGQSWITAVVKEIMADQAAVEHKLKFFEQGATLGPIITAPPGMTKQQFQDFLEMSESAHEGVQNAHKTLYLAGGSDVKVTRASWAQTDFTSTQGKAETRICVASGVPAVIVGVSEGLQGSSLNAGNYNASKRSFVEATVTDLWSSAFAALSTIVKVPDSAELWFDEEDLPYLRQDQQDEATILQAKATAINTFVTAGYTQDSAVDAGATSDVRKLKSTGLVSVQLLPPGQSQGGDNSGGKPTPPDDNNPDGAVRSVFDDLEDEVERAFNADQPRDAHGEWSRLASAAHKLLHGDRAHGAAPLGLIENKKDPILGKVKSKPGPGMTAAEARSLASYREAGFVRVNKGLRKGSGVPGDKEAQIVANIDAAMQRSQLKDHISASRGIGNGPAAFGDRWQGDLTGMRFTDHGFVSVTTDDSIADEFAHRPGIPREGGAHVTVSVPAGVSAVSLGGREHESEILLNRGLTFEIISDTGPGQNRHIHMAVVA